MGAQLVFSAAANWMAGGLVGQTDDDTRSTRMDRFRYEVVPTGDRWAIVRRLANGNVAGYDAVAHRNDEQRHYAIRPSWCTAEAAADGRTYPTADLAHADVPP